MEALFKHFKYISTVPPLSSAPGPTRTKHLVPTALATEDFEEEWPIRSYTVFGMEQQVQPPLLDPDNRYTIVQEVRICSHASALEANENTEKVIEERQPYLLRCPREAVASS